MRIKDVVDEDVVNYKQTSMFIITSRCSLKCDIENGTSCCQNSSLIKQKTLDISDDMIIQRYLTNPITKAIVFGGLEPMDQFEELCRFIYKFRSYYHCGDTIVIYTGYNKSEITKQIEALKHFPNIIIKFGRYVPNQDKHLDAILGVYLSSNNQFAEIIC